VSRVNPEIRRRTCAFVGCPAVYETPHGIAGVPAKFCSATCHRASKTPKPAQPRATLITTAPTKRARAISPASPAQRNRAAQGRCVVCNASGCHPAHLIDRSLAEDAAGDPRAVVPLCPTHHREYDEGGLSLLAHLEPHGRDALAYAVERFGLLRTLERVTNERWTPISRSLR
jgi:hypothetical protein